ncbi:MAG TPA: rRNA maturation RNase YbeY [Phycisphaerae bacterium]|nr:rRNA maturation RNase YbeY [Phycisphaerae bacterium]HPS53626.1 rRNA maturation RNase YbeY [Phycisphaerae bacterium]
MSKIIINIDRRNGGVKLTKKTIADLVSFVAASEHKRVAELDLAIVSSAEMAEMNHRFLGHEGDTDVITFDLTEDDENIVVQLIVCDEVAFRVAEENGLTPVQELSLYIIHGLLHTMGYDDITPAKFRRMKKRQNELLNKFRNFA